MAVKSIMRPGIKFAKPVMRPQVINMHPYELGLQPLRRIKALASSYILPVGLDSYES
jgi:hypothetical protein